MGDASPYIPLGRYLDVFYLYLRDGGQVVGFKKFGRDILMQHIAPKAYWIEHYKKGNGEGIDWEGAIADICAACRSKVWTGEGLRRTGLWRDGECITAHLGDRLLVDGELSTEMVRDGYIYEKGRRVACDTVSALEVAGCQIFLDVTQMFPWTNSRYVPIYAGWCVLAFIGGALDWRPHIWVTGKAESGKSKLVKNVTLPVLSGMVLNIGGASTMAGIGQALKGRSCPVVFDEMEGDDTATNHRIKSILRMVRGASVETGAEVARGTANGTPRMEDIRSMFYFSSVAHSLEGAANTSRTEVVELDNALFAQPWSEVAEAAKGLQGDYGARFAGRAIRMIPVIRQNIEVFTEAFYKAKLGSARDFDMLAAFMSGYTSLLCDNVVTVEWASALIAQYNWKVERVKVRDEDDLWRYILDCEILVEFDTNARRNFHATVGELLDFAIGFVALGEEPPISMEKSAQVLGRFGIAIEGQWIYVRNGAQRIREALSGTRWDGKFEGTLKRIAGARLTDNSMRFGPGTPKGRALMIPSGYLRES